MKNKIGLEQKDYQGSKSTLCTGCGHDNVTQHIISAYFKSGVHPHQVAKISGIGCSSKTPAYFLRESHGFNTIHGRMAAVATGAKIANKNLKIIGVSGDGDTASIGLGGFLHTLRRNLPMVYILENNGVYGLTKGQFSATAEKEFLQKSGEHNLFSNFDLCALAIEAGCEFVARSFSGDAKQLVPLIQAAIEHPGTAFIDVISPCIAYANHEGSTKSYDYVKEHKVALQELGFISEGQAQEVEYAEGESTEIKMASGSKLTLKKLHSYNHDVTNALSAMQLLHSTREQGQILTGLMYCKTQKLPLDKSLQLSTKPLYQLSETDLIPSASQLKSVLSRFR
jgi:2-oxoglutarate/2-oxoacid ferredoxin oxidoreductase subunit beta